MFGRPIEADDVNGEVLVEASQTMYPNTRCVAITDGYISLRKGLDSGMK